MRIRPEDKARLDRLQAQYQLKRGKRVSLDIILGRMIEVAARHEDEVLAADQGPRLTAAERRRIMALSSDWGLATSSDTIDHELYGGDA